MNFTSGDVPPVFCTDLNLLVDVACKQEPCQGEEEEGYVWTDPASQSQHYSPVDTSTE